MKTYRVKINGKTYNVQLEAIEETSGTLVKEEQPVKEEKVVTSTKEGEEVLSPIQGNLLNVLVKEGQKVKKGDVLVKFNTLFKLQCRNLTKIAIRRNLAPINCNLLYKSLFHSFLFPFSDSTCFSHIINLLFI